VKWLALALFVYTLSGTYFRCVSLLTASVPPPVTSAGCSTCVDGFRVTLPVAGDS
jgi:hypothetical protein